MVADVLVNGSYQDENGNKIISSSALESVRVKFHGKNNFLIINDKAKKLGDLSIEFTSDAGIVMLGDNSIKGNIWVGYKSKVVIGDRVTSTGNIYITSAEETKVIIGDDCMFATNNQIRTDDAHAIYDIMSGERLNYSKDILIGAHVWVAYNAVVFGGTEINMGSIVGYGSLLKGKFPNNIIAIGTPAKISRRNVAWDRPNLLWSAKDNKISKNISKTYWDKTNIKSPIYFGDGCSYLMSYLNTEKAKDTDDFYFNLDLIKIVGDLLYIRGNALYKGVECYDYNSSYKYMLRLKSEYEIINIPLGKDSDYEISKKLFDGRHISYNKSKFTTLKNKGINLGEIPTGLYRVYFVAYVNGNEEIINLHEYIHKEMEMQISDTNKLSYGDDNTLLLKL